ncbi:hypothetical protein EHI8A_166950 [Entamoeba histolytica HM-1:IMSS-B]|uniref:Importin alpha n=5 Tax=Entamoeba histolytica TaxID=5759 RepID=C4M1W3_ENTH1|nr:hypothetical protein EHI_027770 [Entamoeba histolytica HM-1:IMSS]EMD49761.1 Hypothetical protein EHI5A_222980 [Entamoeba histolytica KU27]EMH76400.1 hypothetical protein EHI8A_166950 [Entamoeba histolytica HM-1:IMSS-B]EMS14242.1 hypothetical protein KM1_276420 [Entamoeba histolytica HM-3:IMSS]ENY63146.1 hypothetical protein EHI7A_121420 [Entamoeba histolytica HM-1:IMSS-A]EAL52187.2 hypothetical protein EHI_027770 [Entamoeba histolytica HM-1:IMSS]|eukprot:XP_657562.2 hypothetical protein EHI_027770 [Entamoeba histolytica HM-1:IMSS]
MFRKNVWTFQSQQHLHSQLRTSKRLEMLSNKRTLADSVPKEEKTLIQTLSVDSITQFKNLINSNSEHDILQGLNGFRKLLLGTQPPLIEIYQSGVLPRLSQLISGEISIKNLAVGITASMAAIDNPQIIDEFIQLGIAKQYADILCSQFKLKFLNIFEQAANGIGNIMGSSPYYRDICLSYGFFNSFLRLCDRFLSLRTDPTMPTALCHVIMNITSGNPKCDERFAYVLMPYVIKMGQGFEGDTSLYMLQTMVNLSEFNIELVCRMVHSNEVMEFLTGIMNMRYGDFQKFVLQFISNCHDKYPDTYDYISNLYESTIDVCWQASNSIIIQMFSFINSVLITPKYTESAIQIIRNNERFISFLITSTANQNVEAAFFSIEIMNFILMTKKHDFNLIQEFQRKGIIIHVLSALTRLSVQERPNIVSDLLDIIIICMSYEINNESNNMVGENFDFSPIQDFEEKDGKEIIDTICLLLPEFDNKVNTIKQIVFSKRTDVSNHL